MNGDRFNLNFRNSETVKLMFSKVLNLFGNYSMSKQSKLWLLQAPLILNFSSMKSINGRISLSKFKKFQKIGRSSKKDGFIFGLFSAQMTSKSRFLKQPKCFRMSIRLGETSWTERRRIHLYLMLVHKTRLLRTLETAFT